MQHDEVIWQTIRHSSCSFMSKIETGNFCRNPYNVTGICNRSSCPLANSRYATIRADKGVFYLYMKSIERAHLPNKLWERVKLPKNYLEALEVIDKHLMFWPKLLVHKVKQRLTKLTQMRIRMRKLELKTSEKLMTMPSKITKLDARRLEKAEKAALIDKRIEEELVYRHLKYDGEWHGVPGHNEDIIYENTDKELVEYVEADEDLEEEDDMEDYGYYMTIGDDEVELEEDNDEDMVEADTKLSAKLKKPVIIEVEHEGGSSRQKQTSVY